jgi:hypothetical protein
MRKEITIMGDAIQYGDLGQLHLSDCILHIDDLVSIRGDVAYRYIREKLEKEGSLPPMQTVDNLTN